MGVELFEEMTGCALLDPPREWAKSPTENLALGDDGDEYGSDDDDAEADPDADLFDDEDDLEDDDDFDDEDDDEL